jgi:hypothetical protein
MIRLTGAGLAPDPMLCPSRAHQGCGYPGTLSPGHNARIRYSTIASSVNGRPCIANPVMYGRRCQAIGGDASARTREV